MKIEQYNRAAKILKEISGIKAELVAWADNEGADICQPLLLRMGGPLNHIPPGAFEAFRISCVTGMRARIKELENELVSL